ncbi:MAG: carbohydrate ABC transporter permease [Anaerolineaceae bacterium]|nr:MAG: carbohydrate ABC transporter permease [Anaerolineaceae bacterium]
MAERTLLNPHPRNERTAGVQRRFSRLVMYLILGLWSLFTIFSISWIMLASLKSTREIFREPFKLPSDMLWENYVNAWNSVRLGDYIINSVIVVTVSLVVLLAVSAPAAYALSRFKFRGAAMLTMVYIAGMGIPFPLLFIPLFAILTFMRLINTLPGLMLVYVALSIPFTVFLLTGFFATLPKELEEAALIDGCSNWQTFWHVMLPLASPGVITAAIFNGIGLWNEYQLALVFINNPDNRTLSLGLYSMQNAMQYTGDWPGLFAGVVIVMVPTILLYIFLSEKMISGITMGAVK